MQSIRRAAWLCTCLSALAPQVSFARTAQEHLIVSVTVIAPCRVSTQAGSVVSCTGREAPVTKVNAGPTSTGSSTSETAASYAKFVEVIF